MKSSTIKAAKCLKSKLALYILLFFSAFCGHRSFAQNGSIAGKVTDEKQEGLIGASILILDPAGKAPGKGTTTDYIGHYTLTGLQAGYYTLKFNYIGYSIQIVKDIRVDSGRTSFCDVSLKPNERKASEAIIIACKRPLINKGDTKIEQSVSRSYDSYALEEVAGTAAGVQQNSSGAPLSIHGARADEVQYRVSSNSLAAPPAKYKMADEAEYDMEPLPVKDPKVQPKTDPTSTAVYKPIVENPFKAAAADPLSTFSIDVDAASYSIMRRMVLAGTYPPADALRTEEMINYFPYNYAVPEGKLPFSIQTELAECPWNKMHKLLKIGIQGRKVAEEDMPPANLVYLVDVSGSMWSAERLPLVKYALNLLTDQMRPQDRISLVVYAGNAGLVLPSTSGKEKTTIKNAINTLEAGGSTAGGAGIKLAYKIAAKNFIPGGNNRIILCTDGDFNVGASSDDEMVKLIEQERNAGVFLSCIGVGTDNYKDSKMEQMADKGNGNYSYLDNAAEAKKIMVTQLGGTILTIAKDVKIQAVFNPNIVKSYRLIGYENRKLNNEDFKNDRIDAGEIGAGACVTALYEIVTGDGNAAAEVPLGDEEKMQLDAGQLMSVRIRYKAPDGEHSSLIEHPVAITTEKITESTEDFRFASAVAAFSMILRGSAYKGDFTMDKVIGMASAALGRDENGYRKEFVELAKAAAKMQPATAAR